MTTIIEPSTERLILRQWKHSDWPAFAELNADPQVMEFFPATLSSEESHAQADTIQQLISERGWGFWAVEEKQQGEFIGFVGLHIPLEVLPCSPCTEIGWRLAKKFWGKGYATEAAQAALEVAFKQLQLDEIVAFTTVNNSRSQAVMQRLNMFNTHHNFNYPGLPVGHELREHVLYKITRAQWLKNQ